MALAPASTDDGAGNLTPVDPEEVGRTERVLLGTFVAIRSLHIGLGALHLALEPAGFSSRRRGWAGLALSATSTAFVARRISRRAGARDSVAVIVDTCAHIIAVRLGDAALASDRGTGSENVAFLPSTWSPAVAAAWSGLPVGGAALVSLAANWLQVGSRESRPSGGVVSNITVYLGIFTVAHLFARTLRSATDAAVKARFDAVREAEVLSAQESRLAMHSALHRRTVSSLGEIREVWIRDRDEARRRARLEASRVRRFISSDGAAGVDGLTERLGEVIEEAASHGLNVDLHVEETTSCPAEILDALCAGVGAALRNVNAHAETSVVVVRVVVAGGDVRAVIRDHGSGFQQPEVSSVPPSVAAAVAGVLDVECRSEIGAGTRIVISSGAQ